MYNSFVNCYGRDAHSPARQCETIFEGANAYSASPAMLATAYFCSIWRGYVSYHSPSVFILLGTSRLGTNYRICMVMLEKGRHTTHILKSWKVHKYTIMLMEKSLAGPFSHALAATLAGTFCLWPVHIPNHLPTGPELFQTSVHPWTTHP